MDDTKVMLKTIINGQSSMKSELLAEIKKLSKRIDKLEIKMGEGFEDLKNALV